MFEPTDITAALQISQILSALLTPTIGLVVAYVAYQQWQTNQAALREKLFERRLVIFKETQSFLSEILISGRVKDENLALFLNSCHNSRFLCGKKTQTYLLEIHSHARKARLHHANYKDLKSGHEKSRLIDLEEVELT